MLNILEHDYKFSMPRQSRQEQRMLREQDTVGMRRAERKEMEELAGKKRIEAALTKAHCSWNLRGRKGTLIHLASPVPVSH